jgi:hypothetical protein
MHGTAALDARLADRLGRVAVDALPLDRALEDALEHREHSADRVRPNAVALELGAKAGDDLRAEVAQPVATQPREDVPVPRRRVALKRVLRAGRVVPAHAQTL